MDSNWVKFDGKEYILYNGLLTASETLPIGIYSVTEKGLAKVSDKFSLPEKIYGIHQNLIDRVITTFNSNSSNLGVLFRGIQGTGKTIAAKIISNTLGIPVILANKSIDYSKISSWIQQDCIIFCDELEKIYNLYSIEPEYNGDEEDLKDKTSLVSLLSIMDGVESGRYKRLFLITTNSNYLPSSFNSRPSRIRYSKAFSNLCVPDIKLILEDSLEDKSHIENIVSFLKAKSIVTVDIVKSVANEVNIYSTSDKEFLSLMNIKESESKLYLIAQDGTTLAKIIDENLFEGYNFVVNIDSNRYSGRIETLNGESKTGTISYYDQKGKKKITNFTVEEAKVDLFQYAF